MIGKLSKVFGYASEFGVDCVRAIKHNYQSPFEPRMERVHFRILILAHAIEKGLSLHDPRRMFGRAKIDELLNLMQVYGGHKPELPMRMALGALRQYHRMHEDLQNDLLERIAVQCDHFEKEYGLQPDGGTFASGSIGIDRPIWEQRSSCRIYQPQKVDLQTVEQVIESASKAPSQCNRQSVRVHCYQNRQTIASLLQLQGGSTGFSEQVSNLFVISSKLVAWGGPNQRNQGFIDGGLFAMTLMLACHDKGLASCPLNLAVSNSREREIRTVGNIPHGHRLIMMLAFGYPAEPSFKAARSRRLEPSEIVTFDV